MFNISELTVPEVVMEVLALAFHQETENALVNSSKAVVNGNISAGIDAATKKKATRGTD